MRIDLIAAIPIPILSQCQYIMNIISFVSIFFPSCVQ